MNLYDVLELLCLALGAIVLFQKCLINHISLNEYWFGRKEMEDES